MKEIICPRCGGSRLTACNGKGNVLECTECGYVFKDFNDTDDIMLKLTELAESGDITDVLLYDCMECGVANTGRIPVFGRGRLHITADRVESGEVRLTFHYRDASKKRTATVKSGEPLSFREEGHAGIFDYVIEICGDE